MKGYLIVEVEITDPAAYEKYRQIAPPILARHGGRIIVRGGRMEPVEGGWSPKRLVVAEFPSFEQAQAFYHSPEYQKAVQLRLASAKCKGVLIEGE
jgi:uncharacterized protein (DUF1330 family)